MIELPALGIMSHHLVQTDIVFPEALCISAFTAYLQGV